MSLTEWNTPVRQEWCQARQKAELMKFPTLGLAPVWGWCGIGGRVLGPGVGGPKCWVWVLGAEAVGWNWGWGWGWRPGLGLRLAHSVKCKHEDLDSILRTYIRQARHDGAQL